jgi:hypothetical protein
VEVPSPRGPRQPGQSSERTVAGNNKVTPRRTLIRIG